jgi:hypothetical protein
MLQSRMGIELFQYTVENRHNVDEETTEMREEINNAKKGKRKCCSPGGVGQTDFLGRNDCGCLHE